MGPEKVIFLWTGRSTEVEGKSSKAALGGLRGNKTVFLRPRSLSRTVVTRNRGIWRELRARVVAGAYRYSCPAIVRGVPGKIIYLSSNHAAFARTGNRSGRLLAPELRS